MDTQDAQPLRSEQRGSFAPGGERDGRDAGTRLFGQHGEILPEIQTGPQFCHRLIALAHLRRSGRHQQPPRQRLLADVGAGGAKKFEQRPLPEQVQVLRIRVGRVEVRVAGFSAADPLALEASQRPLEVTVRRGGGDPPRPRAGHGRSSGR